MTFQPSDTTGNTYLPQYRNFYLEGQELTLLLSTVYTQTATSVNLKINGVYDLVEVQTGSQYNSVGDPQKKRFSFRQMYYIDPAALTFNHNITGYSTLNFVNIYGVVNTAVPDARPLPYVDTVNVTNQIGITVNATQVIITNGATAPAITGGIVVLEYLKN